MPRKSPRARRKATPSSRIPKSRRPRAAPGKGRNSGPARSSPPDHAARGARRHGAKGARGPAILASGAQVARERPPRAPRRRAERRHGPDLARVRAILAELERLYPEATTALQFDTPLQLLIATILSAQCTDERVNRVTPSLFRRYPDAAAFAAARRDDLEAMVRPTGFFRNKTRAILACCRDIVDKHGGQVPGTLEELTALHGVGRKTANVVLGNAFAVPGLVVDTHVSRVSRRLGLTTALDPVKIEFALMEVVPRDRWTTFSHWLILHGRRICAARKPRCSLCTLAPHCPRLGVVTSR